MAASKKRLRIEVQGINPSVQLMDELSRVTSDPNLYGGRPCIRGLRISVADILDMLAGGATREDILRDYPYLEDADITAALRYGAKQSNHPLIQTT